MKKKQQTKHYKQEIFNSQEDLEVDKTNGDSGKELYPTPVNILNYRSLDQGSDEINRGKVNLFYFMFSLLLQVK